MREVLTGGLFAAIVLVSFLAFVALGWPGTQDKCVGDTSSGSDNTCWCEAVDVAAIGQPGVRQGFNTWSNLMALGYGAVVGFAAWRTRVGGGNPPGNRMRSRDLYPLAYLCVVLFLGLGSMWFHASITSWGGVFDQLSMFTFATFLLAYTIARLLPASFPDWPVAVGYVVIVAATTAIAAATGIDSAIPVAILVVAYVGFEIVVATQVDRRSDITGYLAFYLPAWVAFGAAFLVWTLSQSGKPWCDPAADFQPHGLWHWLAGLSSVLLYFYWRRARA